MVKGRIIRPVRVKRVATNVPYNKAVTLDERIADLEKKRDEIIARIDRMRQVRDIYGQLPFGEGDVAFHAEYGNVIIKSIEYGPTEDDFQDIKYNAVTLRNGTVKKSYKEFVPITEATKILYGEKK